MTMKVTEHKVTAKRKHHPNDGRYPCRSSQEVLQAGMKLMSSLSQPERDLMRQNDLILDEEETAELYDAIQVGDIIGLGILRKNGFISNKYEVVRIIDNEDYMLCKNLLTEDEEEVSFQDISVGFAMGFAEILYRDEKPFGVSENIEITLKIQEKEEEGDEEDTATEAGAATPAKALDEIDDGVTEAAETTPSETNSTENEEEAT